VGALMQATEVTKRRKGKKKKIWFDGRAVKTLQEARREHRQKDQRSDGQTGKPPL